MHNILHAHVYISSTIHVMWCGVWVDMVRCISQLRLTLIYVKVHHTISSHIIYVHIYIHYHISWKKYTTIALWYPHTMLSLLRVHCSACSPFAGRRLLIWRRERKLKQIYIQWCLRHQLVRIPVTPSLSTCVSIRVPMRVYLYLKGTYCTHCVPYPNVYKYTMYGNIHDIQCV